MAKTYTCGVCGEEIAADMETRLVEMVQDHAREEHDMEMEAEDIRTGIEDT